MPEQRQTANWLLNIAVGLIGSIGMVAITIIIAKFNSLDSQIAVLQERTNLNRVLIESTKTELTIEAKGFGKQLDYIKTRIDRIDKLQKDDMIRRQNEKQKVTPGTD